MARSNGRYLWGRTLMEKVIVKEYIDLDLQSTAPDVKQGRLYVTNSGVIKFCADGTNYSTVTVS